MLGTMTSELRANPSHDLPKTLLHVAWMSIAIGIVLQFIAAAVSFSATLAPFVTQLSQKISWSMITCLGLAIGTASSKARPTWMGVSGFLAAPVSFAVARTVQKVVGGAMGTATGDPSMTLLLTLASLKAIEYAILGVVIGRLSTWASPSLSRYLLSGVAIGLVFSSAIVAAQAFLSPARPPAPALIGLAVNEFLFPPFCAMVIFVAERLGAWKAGQATA